MQEITLKLPTDYTQQDISDIVSKKLRMSKCHFEILKKSLDARNKKNIHWVIRVRCFSESDLKTSSNRSDKLQFEYKQRSKRVCIIGSGPAGIMAAIALQSSGFNVTVFERGLDVEARAKGIADFENGGAFSSVANYAFGEGGAGTFSDGKLTSRSKHISLEREYIIDEFIRAGAPEEIRYLNHPHLGSDSLRIITKNLRDRFCDLGGQINFETMVNDIDVKAGRIRSVITENGETELDYLICATGHSAYETYRMLMHNGVKFSAKNFAIGARVEHRQSIINKAQWGREKLPGVKAAEYRLTANIDGCLPVYTFCMCPGGTVVPAAAYEYQNIVNGMSDYARDREFANSACVAGVNLESLFAREIDANAALTWLEGLERSFKIDHFKVPGCRIKDFIDQGDTVDMQTSSYPLGVKVYPLWELFPRKINDSLREGLRVFSRKIKGFSSGNILGLESKTSAPIQAQRNKDGLCDGFNNLFICGEASGYAGGIISSAADGLKAALCISNQ